MVSRSVRTLALALGLQSAACITIDRTAGPSGARLDFGEAPSGARTWRCEDGGSIVLEPGAAPRLRVTSASLIVENHARRANQTIFFHWQGDGFGLEYQVPDGPGPVKVRVHAMWKWALGRLTSGVGNFATDGGAVVPVTGFTAFMTDTCPERGAESKVALYRGAEPVKRSPPRDVRSRVDGCILTRPRDDGSMDLRPETRASIVDKKFGLDWENNPVTNDAFGGLSPIPLFVIDEPDALVLLRRDGTGLRVTDRRKIGQVEGFYYERGDTGFFIGRDGRNRMVYVFGPEALAEDGAAPQPGPPARPRGPKVAGSFLTACLVADAGARP